MEKRKETVNDKVEKQAEDLKIRTIHQSGGWGGGRWLKRGMFQHRYT